MRLGVATSFKHAFLAIAVFGFGGFVGYVTDQPANSSPQPELSPGEVVELRFPSDWNAEPVPYQPASHRAASAAEQQLALLRDTATYFPAISDEPQQAALFDPSPLYVPVVLASTQPSQAKFAGTATPLNVARQTPARPGSLLNDAQIATVKKRLRLTPEQEQMWPAVEDALRKIAWKKEHGARTKIAQAGATGAGGIDPNSNEVQQLKSAAFPLVMSFNNDQKQEVRSFARIIGLESVASEF
jgi:hypothetical protein